MSVFVYERIREKTYKRITLCRLRGVIMFLACDNVDHKLRGFFLEAKLENSYQNI